MSTKKSTKPSKSSDHPTYAAMISSAIVTLKDRTGSSRQAITKFVCANYKVDAAKAAVHLRKALKKGIEDGVFKKTKESGKGAGCFKLVQKPKEKKAAAKPPAKKKAVKKSGAGADVTKKKAVKKSSGTKTSKVQKKTETAKKTKAANVITPGKKSVTKKPKAGKESEKTSKEA